jgi:hypothetical protein
VKAKRGRPSYASQKQISKRLMAFFKKQDSSDFAVESDVED